MLISIDRLAERIEAACFGVLAAEAAAGGPAAADDFLHVAESLGVAGGFDEEDLRSRGMASLPLCGPPGLVARALPLALLMPLERPRLRRHAQRCVALAGPDEGAVVTAVAAALLVADLLRFDLATALLRVHQSLLEEAPSALLDRLRPLEPDTPLAGDEDPSQALRLAITALDRSRGLPGAIGALGGADPGLHTAITLAAVLAAARDGLEGTDEAWLSSVPHRARASQIARGLAERAVAERDT